MRQPEVFARRAHVGEMPPLVALLETVATPAGYVVCLFGSVLHYGEGRDIDLLVVPVRAAHDPADTVASRIGSLVDLHSRERDPGSGDIGISATAFGFALDITVVGRR